MTDHDAIIIGTGQSGPLLARRLVAAGQKVAVIIPLREVIEANTHVTPAC